MVQSQKAGIFLCPALTDSYLSAVPRITESGAEYLYWVDQLIITVLEPDAHNQANDIDRIQDIAAIAAGFREQV